MIKTGLVIQFIAAASKVNRNNVHSLIKQFPGQTLDVVAACASLEPVKEYGHRSIRCLIFNEIDIQEIMIRGGDTNPLIPQMWASEYQSRENGMYMPIKTPGRRFEIRQIRTSHTEEESIGSPRTSPLRSFLVRNALLILQGFIVSRPGILPVGRGLR